MASWRGTSTSRRRERAASASGAIPKKSATVRITAVASRRPRGSGAASLRSAASVSSRSIGRFISDAIATSWMSTPSRSRTLPRAPSTSRSRQSSGTPTPPAEALARRIRRRSAASGGSSSATSPAAICEHRRGSKPSLRRGRRSAESTTRAPASSRWTNVWNSSSCVAVLEPRNWTSSITSSSQPWRKRRLNGSMRLARIAVMNSLVKPSAEVYTARSLPQRRASATIARARCVLPSPCSETRKSGFRLCCRSCASAKAASRASALQGPTRKLSKVCGCARGAGGRAGAGDGAGANAAAETCGAGRDATSGSRARGCAATASETTSSRWACSLSRAAIRARKRSRTRSM